MRINNLNNRAFSLLEVLLASIIFVISITGVFITLTALRKPVADKENALAAAILGKQVLEALRSSVNAGTFYSTNCFSPCSNFDLSLGTHLVTPLPSGLSWPASFTNPGPNPNNGLYYTVTCSVANTQNNANPPDCVDASGHNDIARQVNLSINWPDAP